MTVKRSMLIGRTRWLLKQFKKKMWVRAALFSLGAVATAVMSAQLGPLIPAGWELILAAGSVDSILNILATSMLTVTTFSLSIMVTAYGSATSNVTPRSTTLLLDDSVAQNTLSTFLGSFLFSIVGIIGLAAGLYEGNGRLILFMATLVVVVIITAALLRWIDQLGKFGRVGDTISRVEAVAIAAARLWGQHPRLGTKPLPALLPGEPAVPLRASRVGYVQHVDIEALERIAVGHALELRVTAMPGAFVTPEAPLLWVSGADQLSASEHALRDCFALADERNFDQDPRYGLIVLSEIASRALSPAVNDPGTAINVLDAGARVIESYLDCRLQAEAEVCTRVFADDLDTEALFFEFFNPIARDGAAMVEVQTQIQSVLQSSAALAGNGALAMHARAEASAARARAMDKLESPRDRDALTRACHWLQ